MKTPFIITASGSCLEIDMSDPDVRSRFEHPEHYTETILRQINEQNIYGRFFKGKSGMSFIDAGANIGLVSLYASDACEKMAAIEPSEDHFSILTKLCSRLDNLKLFPVALAHIDGMVEFARNPGNTTMSRITAGGPISVPSVTLSTFLNRLGWSSVDLIKVDIEGGEELAITPEQISACRDRVKEYYLEVHGTGGRSLPDDVSHFGNIFSASGYAVEKLSVESLRANR